jgi:hypothetical protein
VTRSPSRAGTRTLVGSTSAFRHDAGICSVPSTSVRTSSPASSTTRADQPSVAAPRTAPHPMKTSTVAVTACELDEVTVPSSPDELVVDAILQRDYPVIQGVLLIFAGVYVLVNLIIDLLYVVIDPRIRY